eukprot:Polyplicarium_translucidae@DN3332_c0_g1_i4.p1
MQQPHMASQLFNRRRRRQATMSPREFWRSFQRDESFIKRLKLQSTLDDTHGCVNTINWNGVGSQLVVGGDDMHVYVYDYPALQLAARIRTPHHANIFCAKFVPHNEHLVATCAGDGEVRVCDISTLQNTQCFCTHEDRVKEFVIDPSSPTVILSCSEDGTVRQFDLRAPPAGAPVSGDTRGTSPKDVLVDFGLRRGHILNTAHGGAGINSISMAQLRPHYFAVGGDRTELWLLDRRRLSPRSRARPEATPTSALVGVFRPPDISSSHVTGVSLSYDARRLLGSWSHENVHLFDVGAVTDRGELLTCDERDGENPPSSRARRSPSSSDGAEELLSPAGAATAADLSGASQSFGTPVKNYRSRKSRRSEWLEKSNDNSHKKTFKGHLNSLTVKDVQFIGPNHEFVASGSDDGRVFIWDANTGTVLWIGESADSEVVNCIAPHPLDSLIATSGIDPDVKIWAPTAEGPISQESMDDVVQRNDDVRSSPPDQLTARHISVRLRESDYFLVMPSMDTMDMLERFVDHLRDRLLHEMSSSVRDAGGEEAPRGGPASSSSSSSSSSEESS